MTKTIKAEQREEAVALITRSAERFPACFAVLERRQRPLKIGIHQDIIAAVGVAPDELGRALWRYTRSEGYCARLKAGAARIDLDGQAARVVTEDEAKGGQAMLAERRERRAKKRAAAAPAAQTDVRLSVEKLRAAARQRAHAGMSHALSAPPPAASRGPRTRALSRHMSRGCCRIRRGACSAIIRGRHRTCATTMFVRFRERKNDTREPKRTPAEIACAQRCANRRGQRLGPGFRAGKGCPMRPRCRWRIGLDQDVILVPYRLLVSLIANKRVEGKVRQEHVADLGAIDGHLLPMFFRGLRRKLLERFAASSGWSPRFRCGFGSDAN